ncbi:TRAP transporter substrate-binding protein [Thalassospira mesophila]|uniref:C4-dicarboxylate ABC transporter substrate-binding protein n=1 Tax=Thalassospira mesophila TaxID=1293891 RepID=A0A1Y2KVS6_9PROT|nr:TRAP transporter substrate-binding protein [Thalassospira mesophila]OSQ35994.1 C4-dicarboxylate ABC transporter substrate-binding protein [Thalassospira mesophila]
MKFTATSKILVAALCISGLSTVSAQAAEFVAKIGHLESAAQSRNIYLEKVAKLVNERTDGNVEFDIYPQGQLGNQRQMTEGTQLGVLEATVSPAAFLGGFNPAVSVLDIPYLMPQDTKQAQAIRDSAFGKELLASFSAKGVVAIGLWPNGFKEFTSNKPIDTWKEFTGQKFRVMDSNILIEQFKAMDASAISLSFGELYSALQMGVVDGQENPLDTIERMKYYEVQKNLVISDHGAMEDVILFNPTFWNSMPENYRKIIVDTFHEVIPDLVKDKAERVAAALETIKKNGMNVRVATPEERETLRAAIYPETKAAYIERAGDEGKKLVDLYEQAYAKVSAQ